MTERLRPIINGRFRYAPEARPGALVPIGEDAHRMDRTDGLGNENQLAKNC